LEEQKNYINSIKANSNNAYMTSEQRYPKPIKSSGSGSVNSHSHIQGVGNLIGGAFGTNSNDRSLNNVEPVDESDTNINVSFQSHRNNSSNPRVVGSHNFQNQISSQSPQLNDNSGKSFAAEMSKNKQKYMMLQKQQA
jgi:hypothetical protein